MSENMVVQMSSGMPQAGLAGGVVSEDAGQGGAPAANFLDLFQAVVSALNKTTGNLTGNSPICTDGKTVSLDEAMQNLFVSAGSGNGSGVSKKTDSKNDPTGALQQMIAQIQASIAQPVMYTVTGQQADPPAMNSDGMTLQAVSSAVQSPGMTAANAANTVFQNAFISVQNAAASTQNTTNTAKVAGDAVVLSQDTGSTSAQNTTNAASQNAANTANAAGNAVVLSQDTGSTAAQNPAASAQNTTNTANATGDTVVLSQDTGSASAQDTTNAAPQNMVGSLQGEAAPAQKNAAGAVSQNIGVPAQNADDTRSRDLGVPAFGIGRTFAQDAGGSTQNAASAERRDIEVSVRSMTDTRLQGNGVSVQNAADTAASQNNSGAAWKLQDSPVGNSAASAQSSTGPSDISVQGTANAASQNSGGMGQNDLSGNTDSDSGIEVASIGTAGDNKTKSGDASGNSAIVSAATATVHQSSYSKETEPVQQTLPVSRLNELSDPIMKTLESGDKHLLIKLSPPDMGTIEIKLKLENGVLTADFRVDSSSVKDMFTFAMPNIKQSIEASGIKTGNFFADLKDDSNAGGGRQQHTNQQHTKQQKEQKSSFFDFFA